MAPIGAGAEQRVSDGTPSGHDDEGRNDAQPSGADATGSASRTAAERSTPGTSAPADAAAPDGRTRRVRPVRVWDLVLSIVLVLLLIGVAITGVFIGSLFALSAPNCVNGSCDLFTVGLNVAIWGPIVVGVVCLVATITLLVLRKRAFWVPLAGIAGVAVVVFVGGAIALIAGAA
ncbi:hypothetical protein [Agromyces sp. SYSU T00194]|uniref:hypothetical protein n=1 Tax=Agromyces chitinivorans TaxID=3158560 RepID=UPI003390B4DC